MEGNETRPATAPVVVYESDRQPAGWTDPAGGGVHWRTLLSGDHTPTRGLSCGIVEIGPGTDHLMVPHRHAQPEVYHVLAGQGTVTIDGKPYPVRAGATVFIPGDAPHSTINSGAEPLRLFYVFAVDSMDEVVYES